MKSRNTNAGALLRRWVPRKGQSPRGTKRSIAPSLCKLKVADSAQIVEVASALIGVLKLITKLTLAEIIYPDAKKLAAWRKANTISGYNPDIWRRDRFGNLINWNEYGQLTSNGWEIDHVFPIARGGSDSLLNLEALHWRANRQKSDNLI